MAIAKIGSTGSSAGAIQYVLSENKEATKQPEILAGSFGTQAEIKREFEIYNKLNTRVKNQAAHISVSFAAGEKVQVEKKIEFAEKLLEKLDFNNVPYLVVEHHDKEYEHFHVIAGRIRDDGTTVKEWKIAERAIEATKELEKMFGLEQTEYVKSGDRRVRSGEYKKMERTSELSIMAEAKLTIDEILKDEPGVKDFIESLQRSGFDVRPNISEQTGKMNGFSFKKNEIKFKSSAIAKDYAWQNLQKNGLNYDFGRDTEYLIGVKNEFTQKLNLESGRDRAAETPKSIVSSAESITDRAESVFSEGIRPKITETEDRITGNSHLSAKPEFVEVHDDRSALAFAKQSDRAKIPNKAVFENGHGQKSQGNGTDARENSAVAESKDGFTSIDLSFSAPKLNPAPNREADKTDSHSRQQEIIYDKGRSR